MDIQWLLRLPQQMAESDKTVAAPLALRAGDQLTASVLDVVTGSDALLAFDRFNAYARLPLPIVSGQEVQVRVEKKGDRLRMVMVPDKMGSLGNDPGGNHLEIRLFEPVSDKLSFDAHSRSLVPGTSILGRMTGFEKEGLMLVDFGTFNAFAKIDIPVRQGQTLPFKVVKSENGVTFTAASRGLTSGVPQAPPPGESMAAASSRGRDLATHPAQRTMSSLPAADAAGAPTDPSRSPTVAEMVVLREQIPQLTDRNFQTESDASRSLPAPLEAALKNFQQILNPASTVGDTHTLAARVRDFVENSGLYFEKRLAAAINTLQDPPVSRPPAELAVQPAIRDIMVKDLKPNLLILREFMETQHLDPQGPYRRMLQTLKSGVQRSLSNIERQQFMATEKPVEPDLFQAFSHLMFLRDTDRNARLKVYYAKKGRSGEQKHPRISLLLEMDRLGTVRSDLWMVAKDLNVTFFVQDAGTKAAIETDRHRMGDKFKNIFNTVAVRVVVNENKIAEFEGEDMVFSDSRQVDLSI